MKKIIGLLLIACQMITAQEAKERAFNLEPMVRLHGILPLSMGNTYLAKANDAKVSVGFNLGMFEYHRFRLMAGADHILYEPNDISMTADIKRSRYTSFYAIVSYEIPIAKNLSVQPYAGGGLSELYFRRSENSANFSDVNIEKQRGAEYRVGFYLDYKLAKVISVFTGVNYVGSKMRINTAEELESYFGKAQTMQINLGLKLGLSRKDK